MHTTLGHAAREAGFDQEFSAGWAEPVANLTILGHIPIPDRTDMGTPSHSDGWDSSLATRAIHHPKQMNPVPGTDTAIMIRETHNVQP